VVYADVGYKRRMNRYYSNILLYSGLIVLSSIVLLLITCCCQYSDLFKNILIGLFSAILLLLLIEIRELFRDKDKYGKIKGVYKRLEIFNVDQTKKVDKKYESLNDRYKDINPIIELVYHGNREYSFQADYEEGTLKAVIYLDETNPKEGKGHYQYIEKHKSDYAMPDLGFYELQIDAENPKRIYLFHRNQIPSGLSEGYEVFERI